ncbi:MAG: hypothetical protein H0T19_01525, partial [Thermoleophilaceae bacterium]|nr:hypothetical protein [Thermoleophilaceae bacterium]
MVHLRIVAPDEKGRRALELLEGSGSVCNVIVFPDAARKPRGDVLMCDVAREDASAIIEDLRRLDIPSDGSKRPGIWPDASKTSVTPAVTRIPAGNPTARARTDLRTRA